MKLALETLFIVLLVITLLQGVVEVIVNIKHKKPTHPATWIIPAILVGLLYFTHNTTLWK